MSALAIKGPEPGAELVPDGWWERVFVPWVDEQSEPELVDAAAQLEGLEAAYRRLGRDTLELTRARRYLEVRWGELLGDAKPGPQPKSSPASEDLLGRSDRWRFRQLADARGAVLELLRQATDPDDLTRAAILRQIAHPKRPSGDVAGMMRSLAGERQDPSAGLDAARERLQASGAVWSDAQERKRQRALDTLGRCRLLLEGAGSDGQSGDSAARALRDAALEARHAASTLDELAFSFER